MDIGAYLRALKACPDPDLTDNLGIYDNWPILLDVDTNIFIDYLRNCEKYSEKSQNVSREIAEEVAASGRLSAARILRKGKGVYFDYGKRLAKFRVSRGLILEFCSKDEPHRTKQLAKEYRTTVLLHPYAMNGNWTRNLADIVVDIGEYAQRSKVGLCFPKSIGSKNKEVVYYEP
ncbi:hypothetical protein HYU23_01680 [Candidatus Woesearchaeota archaeon]|nr:hypothetical protein [Candidatus Woesearchaeota archaeon]